MPRIYLPVAMVAMVTLMAELLLTRVFDVMLAPNMAYLVITMALLAFGIAGVIGALWPAICDDHPRRRLAWLAVALGGALLLLRPVMNLLPFDYELLTSEPLRQLIAFAGMYIMLALPFFLAGLIFTVAFSVYARSIQKLYCWDLVGASIGCVIIVPLLPVIGPGGELMIAAGVAFLAAALFAGGRRWLTAGIVGALVCTAVPLIYSPQYLAFDEHVAKRGVKKARQAGLVEKTLWDPISKIDIISEPRDANRVESKHVAYDGGQQSSRLYQFDGDFDGLREGLRNGTARVDEHFWFSDVFASHYIKRDTQAQVLILGSAGGQETKAALLFGAARVDAVELVGAVVELVTTVYASFIGNIFNDPRVNVVAAEGRSFLRAAQKQYDIIQIFSNHTSSSVGSGTGAVNTTYLQTADAYREYFTHLEDDGILQVNHRIYPRLVSTAALAWRQLGRTNFRAHVLVTQRVGMVETIPTMLISMRPWTPAQVQEIQDLPRVFPGNRAREVVENPLAPQDSFLSNEFYSGEFSAELAQQMAYRAAPTTDNRPYFKFVRKEFGQFSPDPARYLDENNANMLNFLTRRGIPMDVVHLLVTSLACLLMSGVFIFAPLRFANVGRSDWPGRVPSLVYFSSLGAGFIILELVLIQVFMKLIGSPLYTYSLVIFTMLLAAGLGSANSPRHTASAPRAWMLPFAAAIVTGVLFVACYSKVFELALVLPLAGRLAVAFAMLFPLGYFMGMPFPLGITAIAGGPRGAVAWAWAMNGLFTVVGGLATVIISIYFGFRLTILVGLGLYALAWFAMLRLRAADPLLDGAQTPLSGRAALAESGAPAI